MDDKVKLTEKPGYYAVIPAAVRYDRSLSPNSKLLYGEITCLLNFRGKCFASNAYFSRLYEVSERQISRMINELKVAGHIDILMQKRQDGTDRFISLAQDKNVQGGVDKNVVCGQDKKVYHNKHSININSLSEDKENALFIEFWNIFPNHKGLKETFKSWGKLTKETHQLILKKIKPWLLDNGDKFMPYPATWLNQERWNDELTPMKPEIRKPTAPLDPIYSTSAYKVINPDQYNPQTIEQ
jgi:hypothetical protein